MCDLIIKDINRYYNNKITELKGHPKGYLYAVSEAHRLTGIYAERVINKED